MVRYYHFGHCIDGHKRANDGYFKALFNCNASNWVQSGASQLELRGVIFQAGTSLEMVESDVSNPSKLDLSLNTGIS